MAEGASSNWPAMTIAAANAALAGEGSPVELEDAVIRGVPMKVYKNAPPTINAILDAAAEQFGDRTYIVYENERVTFRAMQLAARKLAHHLKTACGVTKGDRVAVIMRNYPEWPLGFYAALNLGAIATPMNSWWTAEELEYGLSFAGVKAAVMDAQIYERIRGQLDRLPDLKHILIARDSAEEIADPRVSSLDPVVGHPNDWAKLPDAGALGVALGPEDDATIMYTSGTTGKPKGALATHRAVLSNMFNSMTCQARMFLRKGEAIPAPDPDAMRATLLAVPFFHATGAFAILVPSAIRGDKIVSMYKWDAGQALPIIEAEKVTSVGGVPAIAWQLLEHPDRDKFDLSSIQVISYGGAPSAPELVSTIKKRFPDVAPGNGWGMTETCATATLNIGEDYVHRPSSAGAPPGAVELKICDPEGKTLLPPGEVGELWCKGPMVPGSTGTSPEATAQTFPSTAGSHRRPGALDEEGFCFIIDRAKDMLIRGGENIYCIEVENVLYDHPAVMDAALVGIPHKVLGEEPGAVVTLKDRAQATEAGTARLRRRPPGRLQGAEGNPVPHRTVTAQCKREDPES
jgi:long-chain acyl-CoA synthetase